MKKDILEKVLSGKDWTNIDQLREELDGESYFTPEFLENAIQHAKNQAIRNAINKEKNADGTPKYLSVTRPDDDGKEERVYKQESLFEWEDYKQVVHYHDDRGRHHFKTRDFYNQRAFDRFGKRVQLSFDFADKANKTAR